MNPAIPCDVEARPGRGIALGDVGNPMRLPVIPDLPLALTGDTGVVVKLVFWESEGLLKDFGGEAGNMKLGWTSGEALGGSGIWGSVCDNERGQVSAD